MVPATIRPQDDEMLQGLATILELREETVLVVRLGNPPSAKQRSQGQNLLDSLAQQFGKELPTLADYLTRPDISVADTIGTATAGINVVHGGDYEPELLFSQRMTSFFRFASECYSTVLVYGMELHETTTVEMLARHSDGIILLHDKADRLTENAERTIENLTEIGAPIFGIATRAKPPKTSWHSFGRAKQSVSVLKTQAKSESTITTTTELSEGDATTSQVSDASQFVRAEQENV
jgi:hypothetical protein